MISLANGHEYGHVIDLLYDEGTAKGFVIDPKGWFVKHQFLPIKSIMSIGTAGVMIGNSHVLKPLSLNEKKAIPLKTGKRRLHGTALLSAEGEKLGLLEDVYFMEELGTIIGYEVTEGLVADLVEGRKVVKSQGKLTVAGGRAILTE